MEENISQKINLQQIADSLNLSKFYFSKKFLQHTGVSPIRYFLELKIKHACKLLDESNISVKDVALQIGYDDPYYFSRLFKKIMGLSPTQYRQSQYGH
jgi:transcriptional regulator GlxA family with amidase domain